MINIEQYGEGPYSIVLLHGWSMHSGIWRHFVETLSEHCQVICVDLPGHGLSKTVQPYTLDNLCREILKVLPDSPFHLVGWSLGGLAAMQIAKHFPARVQTLSIIAGNPCFVEKADWPGVKYEVLQGFKDNLAANSSGTLLRFLALQVNGQENHKILLRRLKTSLSERLTPTLGVLEGGLAILRDTDLSDDLSAYQMPVQFILGGKDSLAPVSVAEAIRAENPEIKVEVIEGAGHVPFLSHSQRVAECLLAMCDDYVVG